jgi:type IV secretion system protein VirB1
MDLLTLALVCGPMVAPSTTLRVIEVESAGQSYAIHDNTDDRSYAPARAAEAERLAAVLIRAGHRIDIGLMQINYEVWLKPTGIRLDQAFNPCINIGLGTTILSAAYARELGRLQSPAEALKRALSAYNSGDDQRALAYAQQVLKAHRLNDRFRAPTLAQMRRPQ